MDLSPGTGPSGAPPRWLGWLARGLLRLHPRRFQEAWGREYLDGVAHRWRLERARGRGGAGARTLAVLLPDALGSLTREWTPTRQGTMGGWLEGIGWDLRTAGRSLLRRPLFAALVVGALGTGIAANGAIFHVLDRVVLRPLPFDGGERMVYVMDHNVERGFSYGATQDEYERWREAARTLDALEAFQPAGAVLTGRGPASQVGLTRVSHGLLSMTGVPPVLGRGFNADDAEPDAPAVVMLHEDRWRSAWGADPRVVGRTVVLGDVTREIVGVWPAGAPVQVDDAPDFFTPLARDAVGDRSNFSILLGRMVPGVTPEQVEAELTGLQAALREASDDPEAQAAERARVVPPYQFLGGDFIRGLWVLYVGVGLLLGVAALNAANLLLDRAVDREAELGVRMALGGSGARILRHFILEGALLVSAATLAGVLLARLGVEGLAALAPADLPASVVTGGGGRLGPYALVLGALAVLVCGLVPAAHLRSPGVRRLLAGRDGGAGRRGGRRHLQSALVALQVALAVILVVGSGLTYRSLARLASVELGFDAEATAMFSVRAPTSGYPEVPDQQAFFRDVLELIGGTPGVASVSANGTLPLNYTIQNGEYTLLDKPLEPVPGRFSSSASSSPGFLRTLGIPLRRGRDFTEAEMAAEGTADVILVNEAFARRHGGDVLGRRAGLPGDTVGRIVVGVVGDVRSFGIEDDGDRIQVYYPSDGLSAFGSQRYHVRAAHDPTAVLARIRDRVAAFEPEALFTGARTGSELVAERTDEHRFLALLLASFGAVSLLMALAGVYGAVSLHVRRRTRETGIRIALGAGMGSVSRGILAAGLRPVLAGVVVGAGLAAWLARFLGEVLYQVAPTDPVSFAAAVAIPIGAALVACLAPARRAARVDPVEALRAE